MATQEKKPRAEGFVTSQGGARRDQDGEVRGNKTINTCHDQHPRHTGGLVGWLVA